MSQSELTTSTPSISKSPLDPVWRRVLFDENFQSAWIYDLKTLAFVDVNPAAVQRYGWPREEFLRMSLKDIRPPEDVPALLDRIANFETGRYTSGEWRHLRRDGCMDGDPKIKQIFDRADAAHVAWQTDGSSYWACSDQFVSGIAKGSRYYPRIITTALWMERAPTFATRASESRATVNEQ